MPLGGQGGIMPKIKIESNGTVEGTKVTVDGAELTNDENIVSTHFSASVQYGKWVSFSYATRDENEDGSTEITEYRFEKDEDEEEEPMVRKVVRPSGLGVTSDEAALLTSTTTVGEKYNKPMVIDMKAINPGHAAFLQELLRGTKYTIVKD